MPRLSLDESLLISQAFAAFCRTMEFDRATAVGVLVLLQYHTRQIRFAVGRSEDLFAVLPCAEAKRPLLIRALMQLGALRAAPNGEVEVPGNQEFFDRIEVLRAAGRKGRKLQATVLKDELPALHRLDGTKAPKEPKPASASLPAAAAAISGLDPTPGPVRRPRGRPPAAAGTAFQAACRATWEAYRSAFRDVHGVEPVRNAVVNTQVQSFVKRTGHTDAPDIVDFYVRHPDPFYKLRGHDLGLLIRNHQGIVTQWKKGSPLLPAALRQAGQQAHALDQMQRIRAGEL